ncbi:hypothetical protein [Roseateles sp.]|uniref:hypothetical protein n=1 Tax=Roseateles sp. TaxID=1971397 RepID=UPI003922A710
MPTPSSTAPAQRLQAFLAALAELSEADRLRLLRAYIEYSLEILQANEAEYFDFLAECALLAADNMQDIRLDQIELRVQAIETPPPKAWGEVLTDFALGVGVQIGILVGLELAACSAMALAGWREISLATRAARQDLYALRPADPKLNAALAALQDEQFALQIMSSGSVIVKPTRGGWIVKPGWNEPAIGPSGMRMPYDKYDWSNQVGAWTQLSYWRDRYDEVAARTAIARAATRSKAQTYLNALATYEKAATDAAAATAIVKSGWGKTWRNVIGDERGGVITGTASDALDAVLQVVKQAGTAAPSSAGAMPFLTSEITGRYLNWLREERLRCVGDYAAMKFTLRSTSDEDLLEGDELIAHMLLLGTEVLQRWQEFQQWPHVARAAIVTGIEGAFWREYLSAAGALQIDPMGELSAPRLYEPGAVVGGHLVLGLMPADARVHYQTNVEGHQRFRTEYYPGAARIPQQLAGLLFRRYAKPWLTRDTNVASLLPFKYVAAQYDDVAIPPNDDFWGYPDPVGLLRIDEMRFMVIRFFDAMGRDAIDPQLLAPFDGLAFMSASVGADAAQTRKTWLAGQAIGVDTRDTDPNDRSLAATQRAQDLFAELGQVANAAPGAPLTLDIEQLRFFDELTQLNQDIQTYQLLQSGALERGSPEDKRDPDQLIDDIRVEQGHLDEHFRAIVALFGADEDRRGNFVAAYADAVNAIRQWDPGESWVWYGGDPTPEPAP